MDFRLVGITFEEALQIMHGDDVVPEEIYIEPPEANILTDEDSGEEDDGGLADNLNRNQLRAQAEVAIAPGTNLEGINVSKYQDVEEIFEERPGKENITWIKGDLIPSQRVFPKNSYTQFHNLTIVQAFEKFIDSEIVDYLTKETIKYALFLNEANPKISQEDMKCFIGILILTGYNVLPGRDYYWDSRTDMRNTFVGDCMRRDRFRQILKYIHCADNNKLDNVDKLWKLRPFMDKLKNKFIENWIPEENLDFDESMIKYYGHHSCKQCIRGKPIRFGYKMWCLNSSSGYLVNFDMYQGKNPRGSEQYEKQFGKCIAPLITMIDEFPNDLKMLPFRFYFDNLFTGFNVLYYLKQRGYQGSRTIRENRIPNSCPLSNKKTFNKNKQRGEFDSLLDKDDGIIVVRWLDNNTVCAASTCHGIHPLSNVKRYSQKEKKIIQVSRPSIITEYNRFMGGTDRFDENISRYRISIRRKQWWCAIFTWLLDAAIVNAWTIYKATNPHSNISQLSFRREIVIAYLTSYGTLPKTIGKPSTSKNSITMNRISDDIRYDGKNHLLTFNQHKKKRRCAEEGCSSIVRTICVKCNVGMCIECNYHFHSK